MFEIGMSLPERACVGLEVVEEDPGTSDDDDCLRGRTGRAAAP
jgi:hypothetical protein